ncbi:MAG: hypothetical protein JXR19_10335 [Bacteroidia bacterium]
MSFIILAFAFIDYSQFRISIAILVVFGLISDVLDGIIARRIGTSSVALRKLDSNVDQVFWLSTLFVVFYFNQVLFQLYWYWVFAVVILEILAYVISYKKFKKTVATHSILAKLFTLSLFVFILEVLLMGTSNYLFKLTIFMAILSRLEIIGILLLLKKWATDVPSIFAVGKLNKGIQPKRSKWFNG